MIFRVLPYFTALAHSPTYTIKNLFTLGNDMSIYKLRSNVNNFATTFLQILNFLFEIAMVRHRRKGTCKSKGSWKRDVWLAALSVSRTTAISRKHSLLRRFSYKQFTGLFALRIAFPKWEAFVRCGRIWNPPLRHCKHFCCQDHGLCGQSRTPVPTKSINIVLFRQKTHRNVERAPKKGQQCCWPLISWW